MKTLQDRRRDTYHKILRRNRVFINRAKSKPCTDCKIQYNPWVMQFDHHTASKNFELWNSRKASIKTLERELEKCQVVCANCHADRTYRRLMEKLGRPVEAVI